jgi:hypothetical protein
MRRPDERPTLVAGGKAAARLREFRSERGLSSTVDFQRSFPYAAAVKEKERQRAALGLGEHRPKWSPIGPFAIPHGQTYGSLQPPVSGRISCIAVDPKIPGHILIGSAAGGIWETKDDGSSWNPAESIKDKPFVELPIAIGAIAFNPDDSSVVYAGTGEGNWLSDYGVGLWKSEDGGTTWSEVVMQPFTKLGFYALVIDPLDTTRMLAATTGGLFLSEKDPSVWDSVLNRGPCWDVSMSPKLDGDPKSASEVFAATRDGLYRSENGGKDWDQAPISLADGPISFDRLAVCHARSNGDYVYAFSKDWLGRPALWRRSAFGGIFERTFCPPGIDTNQINYDWFVSTAPKYPNVVYLGAVSLWKGERQDDDSWRWWNISSRQVGDSIHPDQHAIAFGADESVYVGNDGGVFKSADGGTSWQALNKGLSITHFEYIAQHPEFDAWLLGGTQDNGTLRYEGGEAWYQVAVGDGGECATNEFCPYTVYHCFQEMSLERSLVGGGAGSWTQVGPTVPSTYAKLFYPPMEVRGNLVVQAGQSVFVSMDTGTTFQELYLPTDAGIATALWLAGPFQFVVGTNTGDLFNFNWLQTAWGPPQTLVQARAGFISSIRGGPKMQERLWVTYSDVPGPSVYRIDKDGDKWVAVPCCKGLPPIGANVLEVDPIQTDTVYLGTDVGVWRSADASQQCQWTIFSNGLPNAIIGDLAYHAKSRVLRAATRSRGVWELDFNKDTADNVQLYLRHSSVDTGRGYPSLAGVSDPFVPGGVANWWDSTDIQIDSEPYRTASPAKLDFVAFEEYRRLDPSVASGVTRVFVQVHQRGAVPAENPIVRLYVASPESNAANDFIPDLPTGFWDKPDQLPAGSPWSVVGPPVSVAGLRVGRPQVAAFQWRVPERAQYSFWLLAMVTSDNDKLTKADPNVRELVRNEAKCALKLVYARASADFALA